MSAWIEIDQFPQSSTAVSAVALYMSAWIEMYSPSTACDADVALYMSAWIEIRNSMAYRPSCASRTLHECVD